LVESFAGSTFSNDLMRSSMRPLISSSLRSRVVAGAVAPRAVLPLAASTARIAPVLARNYASGSGLAEEEIRGRILDLIKSFEKVDPAKLSTKSTFTEDLGLDSLDAVEVVMAVEEEFSIEIPDAEADEIKSVQEAIDYIAKTPEAT